MDNSNSYSLNNFNNLNKSNNFNNNTLNNFYISDFLSNGYFFIVFNNFITPTVKSEAISVDYIIFPTNKGYIREASINLVLNSNCIG